MRVLLTGATGFIGGALARCLLAQGHELLCAVRDPQRLALGPGRGQGLRADFSAALTADWWRPHLAGIDAVVNAVGILRERPGQRFEDLHTRGPVALFEGCAAASVARVVQISALGADAARAAATTAARRRRTMPCGAWR